MQFSKLGHACSYIKLNRTTNTYTRVQIPYLSEYLQFNSVPSQGITWQKIK